MSVRHLVSCTAVALLQFPLSVALAQTSNLQHDSRHGRWPVIEAAREALERYRGSGRGHRGRVRRPERVRQWSAGRRDGRPFREDGDLRRPSSRSRRRRRWSTSRCGEAAARRRGVHRAGRRLAREPPARRPAATGRSSVPLRSRTESLWPRRVLRAARVGVRAQSERRLRRLEPERVLRTVGAVAADTERTPGARWSASRRAPVVPCPMRRLPAPRSRQHAGRRRPLTIRAAEGLHRAGAP